MSETFVKLITGLVTQTCIYIQPFRRYLISFSYMPQKVVHNYGPSRLVPEFSSLSTVETKLVKLSYRRMTKDLFHPNKQTSRQAA